MTGCRKSSKLGISRQFPFQKRIIAVGDLSVATHEREGSVRDPDWCGSVWPLLNCRADRDCLAGEERPVLHIFATKPQDIEHKTKQLYASCPNYVTIHAQDSQTE